jgi:glycosyltransferase involved in cell wall biosynthesis
MTELSVVLISKNQEWNIARLVESVLKETDRLPAREIVLVDSASTDRTIEIAAQYPISVLRLCPKQRLTAAAGRYVGTKQTRGGLVLFLDGD